MAADSFINVKSRDECFQELKLNADEMEMIKNDTVITKDKKTAPKNMQCYSLCYNKKLNIVNEKIELNEKVLAGLLSDYLKGDQNRVKAVIDKCKVITGADNCEKAFNVEVCLREQTMP